MNSPISFTVPGRPVPAVRMTQRSKWSPRAKRSLGYQRQVATIASAFSEQKPVPWKYAEVFITVHLKVNSKGELPGNRGDWDNYGKGICDGIQYSGVVANDKTITSGHVYVLPCATAEEERVDVVLAEQLIAS